TFKTLCLLNYALMIRHDYDITSSLQRGALQLWYSEPGYEIVGSKDLTCENWKFGGNALAWWKAYKQAKGGDAWLITVTWADFKKLFFLQFFPRAEQERLKMEYHSIRQTNTKTSTECMHRFLRLAGFLGAAAGTEEELAKNF
nr:zinc finger, CCHC-type, retrotransposon Gag domain protein [Tanacetum cinerariifolium]